MNEITMKKLKNKSGRFNSPPQKKKKECKRKVDDISEEMKAGEGQPSNITKGDWQRHRSIVNHTMAQRWPLVGSSFGFIAWFGSFSCGCCGRRGGRGAAFYFWFVCEFATTSWHNRWNSLFFSFVIVKRNFMGMVCVRACLSVTVKEWTIKKLPLKW